MKLAPIIWQNLEILTFDRQTGDSRHQLPLRFFHLDGIPKWYFQTALWLTDDLYVAIWLAESAIFLASILKLSIVLQTHEVISFIKTELN